jgi:hypothetical protein
MTNKIPPRDWEDLSAYMDGQLAPKERQKLEARLQTRADLRLALEELRRTRAVLRARLPVRAPRNFTLTQAMAGVRQEKRQPVNLFGGLRLASAFSTLLFLFVLFGDLWLGGRVALPMLGADSSRSFEPSLAQEAPVAPPEAALEMQIVESAEPTDQAVAKALPPEETPPPGLALEAPAPGSEISETYKIQPGEIGAGGGGAPEDAAEEALADMAPSATATPLPTTSPTPTIHPEEQFATTATEVPAGTAEPDSWFTPWRWLELTLILVSVTTGLLAYFLYRSGRS